MNHRRLILMLALVAALPPAAADAATSVSVSGGALVVAAAPGHENEIRVESASNGDLIVLDAADALAAGSGCTLGAGKWVTCTSSGVTRVSVTAGDLDDVVTKSAATSGLLDGGDGNDQLYGGPASAWNELRGGAGDDEVGGGPDTDLLYGGPGRDRLNGASGPDTLNGDDGDDTLDGSFGADVLNGGLGTDVASYANRFNAVTADVDGVADDGWPGEGDNVRLDVEGITGGWGADTLTGSVAANPLSGGPGADTLRGLGGNDTLTGSSGDDTLDGGDGRDTFLTYSNDGADVYIGGAGSYDQVSYRGRAAAVTVDVDGVAGDGEPGEGDNVRTDVEQVQGGQSDDTLTGNGLANVLDGDRGDDVLDGRGGGDWLLGLAGLDTLRGDAGDDVLDGGSDADVLDGGPGRDRADYGARSANLVVDLDGMADDGASGEGDNVLQTIEDVTGGSGADSLWGSFAANALAGGLGDDRLNGLDGPDTLTGGLGSDLLLGGAGNDSLQAVDGTWGNDELNGQTDADSCASDANDEEFACES